MTHVPARPFAIDPNSTDTLVLTGGAVLCGWALYETSGSAVASASVFDGTSSSGLLVARVDLLKSESTREWYGPNGIELRQGCTFAIVAGAVAGVLYLIAGERYDQFLALQGLRETWRGES